MDRPTSQSTRSTVYGPRPVPQHDEDGALASQRSRQALAVVKDGITRRGFAVVEAQVSWQRDLEMLEDGWASWLVWSQEAQEFRNGEEPIGASVS